jgi:hypothetical protein
MSRSQSVLFSAALIFLFSGLFHAGVWLAEGMPSLAGPVSWRKPMTFGFSTGVLFLSLTWVIGLLPDSRRVLNQVRFFTGLLVVEVALIDMQQWRGVPSHFNNSTPFDAAVFTTMGMLIVTASVIIALWTRELFRNSLPTAAPYAWAARIGMVMLNVGNLIGLAMSVTQSTSLKPMHGIALHVIQALPIALWLIAGLRYPRPWHVGSPGSQWRSLVGRQSQ